MLKIRLPIVSACIAALFMLSCGKDFDKALEEAQFALDSADYATAITKATAALAATPGSFDATMVLSSAYSGRAGVNLLDIAKKLTESNIETQAFNAVHDILVVAIGGTGLADLRTAVTTLTGFTGTISDNAKYRFQLGILQTIEGFGRPSITAQPALAGTITVTNISPDDTVIVRDDLIAADNNLITSGIKEANQLITTIRKSYCVLRERSAVAGFTRAELEDRVRCELDDTRDALRGTSGDFQSATVATCADFNFSTCTSVDTAL